MANTSFNLISNNKIDSINTIREIADQLKAVVNPTNFFDEPITKYNTVYPYNESVVTESGHSFELDDTPNAERVSLAHRTGTFIEIHPDGTRVDKIVNDKVEIVVKDEFIYITGNSQKTINGSLKIKILGNSKIENDGEVEWKVNGNIFMQCTGDFVAEANTFTFIGPTNHMGDIVTKGNIINDGNITATKKIMCHDDIFSFANIIGKGNMTVEGGVHGLSDVFAGKDEQAVSLLNHKHADPQGGFVTPPIPQGASVDGDTKTILDFMDNYSIPTCTLS